MPYEQPGQVVGSCGQVAVKVEGGLVGERHGSRFSAAQPERAAAHIATLEGSRFAARETTADDKLEQGAVARAVLGLAGGGEQLPQLGR